MKRTVAVIFGGVSPEHEVSLASARSVLDHLDPVRFSTVLMGITRTGDWLVGPGAWTELYRQADRSLLPSGLARAVPARPAPVSDFASYPRLPPLSAFAGIDFIFPVAHGNSCEDGVLQGICQSTGLPLIGCDLFASAVCFDKVITKAILHAAGLPVTRGVSYTRRQIERDGDSVCREILALFGHCDLFTKPACSGSSFGITRVQKPEDLPAAFEKAFYYGDRVLIEDYVEHRELVLGVLGNDEVVVSPPGECVPTQPLYSYEEKYIVGNPNFRCPAPVPPEIANRARSLAEQAYHALRCTVFARVDCFLDRHSGELVINEVNTIPGLTSTSVYPKIMLEAGYPYERLLEELIRSALEAHANRWCWTGGVSPAAARV